MMEAFLQKLLHVPVTEQLFDKAGQLPLLITGLYEIRSFRVGEKLIYLIQPKEHIALPQLKKHFVKMTKLLDGDCVLYDDGYTRYGISRLMEMGVPFIFGDNNIYLPNLGIQIHERTKAKLPDVEQFSPFTQKLILTAMYREWRSISGKEIAEIFGVTRMTVNRALVEMEALGLPFVKIEGKTKYYTNELGREETYKLCEDYFINPVKRTIRVSDVPNDEMLLSGVSALAKYTMLGDDQHPTFAINQEKYRELKILQENITPKGENPACVIQIHRYLIAYENAVDPISAILSVPDDELDDARVAQAIEEIKEGVFDGRWT
ncbi:hypothetical protein P261_00543 [Lachnospiraceae bacterium TWA4]|nr:hypothetical protein P261_00543 [Lachnospiraceae bacterium TWA4]